jgi:cation transport protein ChaC
LTHTDSERTVRGPPTEGKFLAVVAKSIVRKNAGALLDTPVRRKGSTHLVTRAALKDGSLLSSLAASAPAAIRFTSTAEREVSLQEILRRHDPAQDVWLFAYGSLMWNPAIRFVEARTGLLHGWHRRYCLWVLVARGTPENPGLMLALDNGGACRGTVMRIQSNKVKSELPLVWGREMITDAYRPRWVDISTPSGPVRAITFVINRRHPRYAGRLSDAQAAVHIASARGVLGTCAEYFEKTRSKLRSMGLRDAGLERIAAHLEGQSTRQLGR